jgi:hypothetical protein
MIRKCEVHHFNYEVSGYHSNELSSVNTLHEPMLCRSGTRLQFVSMRSVYCVSIDNILMRMREMWYGIYCGCVCINAHKGQF